MSAVLDERDAITTADLDQWDALLVRADLDPLKRYMVAMIFQAIADCGSSEHRREAREWLRGEECKDSCETLELDHRMVASSNYVRGAGRQPWVAEQIA